MKTAVTLLAGLLPIAVYAQNSSSVQIYGVLDAGIVAERGCRDGCPNVKLSPGVESGSRLGVKGREQLGGDTAAIFTLEAGVENDTGRSEEGRTFGRQAFVGLDGRWGALTLGRQYNLQYETLADVADPFHAGLAGAATNLMGYTTKRYDNSIKYSTPLMRGWNASAIYSFGESAFSTSRNQAYGATVGYTNSLFNVRVAYQKKNNLLQAEGSTQPVDLSARNSLVAANMNLGIATVYAAFGMNRGVGSSPWDQNNPYGALVMSSPSHKSNDMLVGLSIPHGAATYMVSYIRKDDRTLANMDADQIAVGMTYALSKRSALYAAFAHIKNRNGAPYTVGNATERGSGNKAINVGFRHAF
ncbi:porin [Pseudoduganella sp. RAF53_2]|uniref:porin n=1 Tax=unclassified Pseudoduganella TaxID=2637179 RepID=UPI003F9CB513